MNTKILTALVISTALASATDTNTTNFGGFTVGGEFGAESSTFTGNDGEFNKINQGINSIVSAINNAFPKKARNSGLIYGLTAGFGKVFGNIYLGAEIYYKNNTTTMKKTNSFKNIASAGYNAFFATKMNVKHTMGIAPVYGYVINKFMPYAKLGLGSSKVTGYLSQIYTSPTNAILADAMYEISGKTFTFSPALGLQYKLTKNINLKTEYTYSVTQINVKTDNSYTADGLNTTKEFKTVVNLGKVSSHALTFGASYQF